jgi:hypothetical protein
VLYVFTDGQDHPTIIKLIREESADITPKGVNMITSKAKLSALRPAMTTGAHSQTTTFNIDDNVTFQSQIHDAFLNILLRPQGVNFAKQN